MERLISVDKLASQSHKNKRNKFQIALDRKLTIELLSTGKTYVYIAKHISSIRDYNVTPQLVHYDVGAIQEELLASVLQHGLEAIASELDKIENLQIDISRRISTFRDDDPKVAPFLKQLADLSSRQTHLKGGENYIRAQDLNQAIERVVRAGFKIVDPIDALNRNEPLDIQAEAVLNDD